MRRFLSSVILGTFIWVGFAYGDDAASPKASQDKGSAQADQPTAKADPPAATPATGAAPKTEEAKLLAAVREAMERNAQEIKALKEEYAKSTEEQRKKVEAQQKQIDTLQQAARSLEDRLKAAQALSSAPGDQNPQGQDKQQKLSEIQQKKMSLIEQELGLVSDEVEKQGPAVEKLQTQTATLESRSKQSAERDQQLADAIGGLRDGLDDQQRNLQWFPAPLQEWFLPSGTNVSPLSIYTTVATRYDLFPVRRGAGQLQFEEFTPFFLAQLNKRMLLSGEMSFSPSGVSLGQGQIDIFINNWLTATAGYFLAPIGFFSERVDPSWINKLPDFPVVMNQVIPDGLTVAGFQLRGARYLFGSPFKLEYSAFIGNGFGVPGSGKAADWADLGALAGTTANVNDGAMYGARIGIWLPARGINFGISELVNAPYSLGSGPYYSIWQPYANYHRGNWEFRFEYGNSYENTKTFIDNNIRRDGLYAQIAYRNYASLRQHLQRLEYVFRFSDAFFHGINQSKVDLSAFAPGVAAPVDRNQYTIGVNYYLYASSVFKIAYEINSELNKSLRDNVFMLQFATNF
jgi:hypothetical protein